MNIEDIREEAKKFFLNAGGCHNFEHTERVHALAVHIAEKEGADMEIVKLAALLHDIGRKEQDESDGKTDHAKRGGELAREILKKHGIGEEEIEQVVHCIEAHRFRGSARPETLEAKIISDADKLDGIGAVGIGRAFMFAGEIKTKFYIKESEIKPGQEYTEYDTATREFLVKLRKLKDRMLTREGKRIADERHRFMVDFFKRMDKEVEGEL